MPIYEYRCDICGETFEKFRRMSDVDADVQCPQCESEEVERILSSFATGGGGGGGCGGGNSRFT